MARSHFTGSILLLLVLLAMAAACSSSWKPPRGDEDLDGLSDELEDALLAKYRPYYRFSRDGGREEPVRPADPTWYVRHSDLRSSGDEDDSGSIILPNSTLGTAPNAILMTGPYLDTNINSNRCRSKSYLNPENSFREGFNGTDGIDWPELMRQGNVGLYGHVSRLPNNDGVIRIEYWQFYGYNEVDKVNNVADHEGDWELVVVDVLNPATNSRPELELLDVTHFVHGKQINYFALGGSNGVYFNDDTGLVLELRGFTYSTYATADLSLDNNVDLARAQWVVLRLNCESGDRAKCTHPIVFVEWGSHASWPTENWGWIGSPKHGGDGYHFLTSPPPNLGEVWLPRSSTTGAATILQFNGRWGAFSRDLPGFFETSPPVGPALHRAFTWPFGSTAIPDACLE